MLPSVLRATALPNSSNSLVFGVHLALSGDGNTLAAASPLVKGSKMGAGCMFGFSVGLNRNGASSLLTGIQPPDAGANDRCFDVGLLRPEPKEPRCHPLRPWPADLDMKRRLAYGFAQIETFRPHAEGT